MSGECRMQDALLVKHRGRTLIFRPTDIQWISAEGDYVGINSGGKKYLLRDRISRLEREFCPGDFVRIHRSLLVNRVNIKELEPRPFGECVVILDSGERLPMSRSRKSIALKLLQNSSVPVPPSMPLLHVIAIIALLLTGCWSSSYAQHSSVQSLLTTEQAFADCSAAASADSAFLTYLAPDGILLRPDPVNGKAWIRSHPSPTLMLRWRPMLGIASADGDLGFTTGPYEDWESDDTANTRYHGEFVTAWKRQPDGAWRFVFDFGAGHPHDTWKDPVAPRALQPGPEAGSAIDTVGVSDQLLHAHIHMHVSASTEIRLLRPDSLPISDVSRAEALLRQESTLVTRTPLFADVARSGDLAYTYGRFAVAPHDGPLHAGYYFSIWKRNPAKTWDLLWDVLGRARPIER